jgi:hypothetical protein
MAVRMGSEEMEETSTVAVQEDKHRRDRNPDGTLGAGVVTAVSEQKKK